MTDRCHTMKATPRLRGLLGVGTLVAAVAAIRATRHPDEFAARMRRGRRRVARRTHHLAGQLAGLDYRLHGRHPDESVPDLVLADRVRSELGPVVHALDVPHVHVMVHDHVVTLHGDTTTEQEAAEICRAVLAVTGVRGVRSHLHVGLLPSDTRPSTGRAQQPPPSTALERLVQATGEAGATSGQLFILRSVLGTFLERLPAGERSHVLAHLPEDVRHVAIPPRTWGATRIGTTAEVVAEVIATDPSLDERTAHDVVAAVLAVVADLVPEERDDVAAVLPGELKELWSAACRAAGEQNDAAVRV